MLSRQSKMRFKNLYVIFLPAWFMFVLAGCSNLSQGDGSKAGLFLEDLQCNFQQEPLGVDNPTPGLSWKIYSPEQNVSQSAYQVLVTDSQDKLRSDKGNIWNSGKVNSHVSIQVIYDGDELEPVKSYYWKVRIWDQSGDVSPWSEPSSFVTGFFDNEDWAGAKWIVFENLPDSLKLVPGYHAYRGMDSILGNIGRKRTVIPYFRKEFSADKEIKQAFRKHA